MDRSTYLARTSTSRFTCGNCVCFHGVGVGVVFVFWGGGGLSLCVCITEHEHVEGKYVHVTDMTYLVPDLFLGEDDMLLRVGDEHDGEPALLLWVCLNVTKTR